jgi:phage major head subunit gpT-like protein
MKLLPIRAESVPVSVEHSDDKPGVFSMVAYTGGLLPVKGYKYPVILDLKGVEFRRNVLANLDHNRERRVGQVTEHINDGTKIVLSGLLSAATDACEEVIESSKKGFEWEASIEALPTKQPEFIAAGSNVTVNGVTHQGPVYVARESTLFGVAFLGQGADERTVVSIAASAVESFYKGSSMNFEEWAMSQGFDAASLSDQQKAMLMKVYGTEVGAVQAMSTEEEKTVAAMSSDDEKKNVVAGFDIDGLKAIYASHEAEIEGAIFASANTIPTEVLSGLKAKAYAKAVELKQKAIASKMSVDKFHLQAIKAAADLKLELVRAERPRGPAIHSSSRDISSPVIEAAFCRSRGTLNEKNYDDKTLQTAHTQFKNGIGLQQLVIMAAASAGMHFHPGEGLTQGNLREALQYAFNPVKAAGFSAVDVPGILSNVANKEILQGYEEEDQTWREIAAVKSVNDFKTHTSYRMLDNMKFEKVGPGGEIKHGTLSEESYTRQADTYAKMGSITRKDFINDDLQAFDDMRNRIGRGGAQALNAVFWAAFMNNSSFFTSGRGTFITGATTTLLTDGVGLQLGLTAFRKLKTPTADGAKVVGSGTSVGGRPEILLVPPELEHSADKLYVGTNLNTGNAAGEENTHRNKYRPVVCPWLSDTGFTGNSTTAWYLLRNPRALAPIAVSFLNGNETPTVESADADFSTLGIQFRGYFDFGCDLAEYLAGIKSKGAA